VKGKDAHPFYRWAAAERPLGAALEFSQYLIGRDGYLKQASLRQSPTDPHYRRYREGMGSVRRAAVARRGLVQGSAGDTSAHSRAMKSISSPS
jgi:hypothetical protein